MQKWIKIRGRETLVSNPHAPSERRYAGMKRRVMTGVDLQSNAPQPILSLIDRCEPCDEVLPYHADLLSAAAAGDLELLGECRAETHEEASAKLALARPGLVTLPESKPAKPDAATSKKGSE